MKIGFTGTQRGMTQAQKSGIKAFLMHFKPTEICHGNCIGADAEFVNICQQLPEVPFVICRPGNNKFKQAKTVCDQLFEPEENLVRNDKIAAWCDVLLATPKERSEIRRSGTWATVRYAEKYKKRVFIVYPDGTVNSTEYN